MEENKLHFSLPDLSRRFTYINLWHDTLKAESKMPARVHVVQKYFLGSV